METPLLFVALDDMATEPPQTLITAQKFTHELPDGKFGFKVNLDCLLKSGQGLYKTMSPLQIIGRPIFADIKMWNGSRTMSSVIKDLVELKVDFLNVYALADDLLPEAIQIAEGSKTKILGLTVLSHYDDVWCQKHFRRNLQETVRHLAETAIEAGCHGIILPGTALKAVRHLEAIKTVPGIRPKEFKDDRHRQEITPEEAVENGANILVCGSPIFKSSDKVGALRKILDEINSAAR